MPLCAKHAAFKASACWRSSHVLFSHIKKLPAQSANCPLLKGGPPARLAARKYFLQVLGAGPAAGVSPVLLQHPVIVSKGLVVLRFSRCACGGAQSIRVAG